VVVTCSVATYRHLRNQFLLASETGVAAGIAGIGPKGVAKKQRSVNGILAVQAEVPIVFDLIPVGPYRRALLRALIGMLNPRGGGGGSSSSRSVVVVAVAKITGSSKSVY